MDIIFTLEPSIVIQIVLAVFLPVLVGLVTTRVVASSVKAWLLAGLTLVTSVVTQLGAAVASGIPFDIGLALLAVIPAFTISVATYYGLWKPTGIGKAAQDVTKTTLLK